METELKSAGDRGRLWWLWAVLLAVGALGAKAGPSVSIGPESRRVDLNPYVSYLRDPDGRLDIQGVRAREAAFLPTGGRHSSFGFTADAVWLRVGLQAGVAADSRYVLELGYPRLGEVDWHVFVNGSLRSVEREGRTRPAAEPGSPMSRTPVLALDLSPGDEAEVYVRVHSETAMILPLTLWAADEFTGAIGRQSAITGMLFGYLGAVGIVAIGMALATKDRGFFIYALLIVTVCALYLATDGYVAWFGLPGAYFWEGGGVLALHATACFLGTLFLRHFFDLPKNVPWLNRLSTGVLWVFVGILAWSPFAPFRPVIMGFLISELVMSLGLVAVVGYFWRHKGFRGGRILMCGMLSCYVFSGVAVLQFLGVIPIVARGEFLAFGVICAGTMSALVALGVRVHDIRRENERSQRQALKVQEEINRRLEDEVRLRTAELQKAKENAETANRFKGLFLASISHDIRAPISTLVGLSQALWLQSRRQGVSEEFMRFLSQIRSGGQYLNLILTNLLDLTAAEAGRMPVHRARLDLNEWQESVRNLLDPIAVAHDIRLGWRIVVAGSPFVETDQVRLTQILLNIVHNAIKFTPAGRGVDVSIRLVADVLELKVEDQGPGIPEQDLSVIFEAFRQSAARSAAERGVGLGLSIVKTNADLLGGRVYVENLPGSGACFTMILPDVRRVVHQPRNASVCV